MCRKSMPKEHISQAYGPQPRNNPWGQQGIFEKHIQEPDMIELNNGSQGESGQDP